MIDCKIAVMNVICFVISNCNGLSPSFTSKKPFPLVKYSGCNVVLSTQRRSVFGRKSILSSSTITTMRDRSSANWFNVGDSVRVVDDVMKAGTNLRGRVGTVIETWEKCDVDPTCCCAENVDEAMNVHVKFIPTDSEMEGFVHYFAESELLQIKDDDDNTATSDNNDLPFDGLSCTAFKLQQLQGGEQAQRIAAFEASKAAKEADSK